MALPTASERGISIAPEIKLTHTMSRQDVDKIARVTEGAIQEGTPYLRTYYGGNEKGFPIGIKYPKLEAELDFVGGPIAAISSPQAFLRVDRNDFLLNNSTVVIGEDSVTFVRRPEAETDEPFEPTVNVSIVTITKDGISYQKTKIAEVRNENVLRAATMIDDAYRARAVQRN